jgi:hypothetical protein
MLFVYFQLITDITGKWRVMFGGLDIITWRRDGAIMSQNDIIVIEYSPIGSLKYIFSEAINGSNVINNNCLQIDSIL